MGAGIRAAYWRNGPNIARKNEALRSQSPLRRAEKSLPGPNAVPSPWPWPRFRVERIARETRRRMVMDPGTCYAVRTMEIISTCIHGVHVMWVSYLVMGFCTLKIY